MKSKASRFVIFSLICIFSILTSTIQVEAEEVIFDINLTKQELGGCIRTGGTWDNGWRVTGPNQRIVCDAGRKISKGYIEATFTINQNPTLADAKNNFFGAYENPSLEQSDYGDILYARQGKPTYGFVRWKSTGDIMDGTSVATERTIGSNSDWVTNDQYVHTLKFEWNGAASIISTGGIGGVSISDLGNYPVDELRYAFMGSDNYASNEGMTGIRFLTFKMVDTSESIVITPDTTPGPISDLKISSNGRYILNKDGTPFFYQGDTAWPIFYALTKPEITQYLDERKARGFNVIQILSIIEWSDSYVPILANVDGEYPFINNNPEKFNPIFWDRVKWILEEVRKRDMYVAMTVGGPLRIDKIYFISYDNPQKAYNTGYQFGQTLKDYNDIIIWVGGNDMNIEGTHAGVENNIRAEMEGVADGVNGVMPTYNNNADYSTTIMTYHPSGKQSSSMYFHNEAWLDFNWIQTYGNLDKAPGMVKTDYQKTPIKPTILAEGAYEDTQPNKYINTNKRYIHFVPSLNTNKYYFDQYGTILPWHNRYQAYQTVFSGAAGIGYGHRGHIQTLGIDWSRQYARDAKGAWELGHMHDLMDSYDFSKFVPDNTLIASEPSSYLDIETNMVLGTRSTDNKRAYIYTTRGRSFTAALSKINANDKVIAKWFNPRTGEYTYIGEYSKVNTLFDPPGNIADDNDWVLVLEAKETTTTTCNDGICNGAENCETCPNDCQTPSGQICCAGNLFTGTCCENTNCASPNICINHICQETSANCNGLVLLMHFDENSAITIDESENKNNGIVNGATFTSSGKFNGAFEYDGINNDEINLGDVLDFGDNQDFTITGWFNRKTFTTEDVIISKRLATGGDTNTGYLVYIDDNGDNLRFRVSDGTKQYGVYGSKTFTSSGWHFFTAVFDADSETNTKVYIDGTLDIGTKEGTISGIGSLANNQDLRIGNSGNNAAEFPGTLDEITIWNRVLTPEEISELYNSATPLVCQEKTTTICGNADYDKDEKISINELIGHVKKWKDGQATPEEILNTIQFWKNGCS
jgi:hypothetical protein